LVRGENKIEHFEDIVIRKGPRAALKAIDDMKHIVTGMSPVTTKFDGRPSIIFERNSKGQFLFNDKNRFNAKTYNGRAFSRDYIRETILRRTDHPKQQAYADMMANAWSILQKFTEGIINCKFEADVLWLPDDDSTEYLPHDMTIKVKPNLVEYRVPTQSSQWLGIVIHSGPIEKLPKNHYRVWWQGPERVILGDKKVEFEPLERLRAAEKKINENLSGLLELNHDAKLCKSIYSYNCRNVRFMDEAIQQFLEETEIENPNIRPAMEIINTLNGIKNDVADAFELQRSADGKFSQSINGEPFGEGFVFGTGEGSFKIVKRNFRNR